MGQHPSKREKAPTAETEPACITGEPETELTDDNEVFGQGDTDAVGNNGSARPAVTDSAGTEDAWHHATAADPSATRPHLIRLFSRDAPGREDNTFKDRPSESDELQTIPEQCGAELAEHNAD